MARKPSAKNLTLQEIQDLLEQKIAEERKKLPKLTAKRDRLQADLDEINEQIAAIEGSAGPAPKKRGRKPGRKPGRAAKGKARGPRRSRSGRVTLPQAIEKILAKSSEPMSPNQITAKIQRSKHPSAESKSLRLQVTTTLSKRDEFERVGRGQYQLAK